eukprot:gene13643-18307_t
MDAAIQPDLERIRFMPFVSFQAFGRIPRFPVDNNRVIVTLQSLMELETMRDNTLFVFVSHRWLRSQDGFPDDENNTKFELCCSGIQAIMDKYTNGFNECYIWLDYCCVNQTNDPASELTNLDVIIRYCDILFTPLVEYDHNFQLPALVSNWYEDCPCTDWLLYLSRAWCRIEMFYGTHLDLWSLSEVKLNKFLPAFQDTMRAGRRPHFIYPNFNRFPFALYPFQDFYYHEFRPLEGDLSQERDRIIISNLESAVSIRSSQPSYLGDLERGLKNGKGILLDRKGDKYIGSFVFDQYEGSGILFCADGNGDAGEFKRGKLHGFGYRFFLDGSWYCGYFKNAKKHGQGIMKSASGRQWCGNWINNKLMYENLINFGTVSRPNGIWYTGEIQNQLRHGFGVLKSNEGIYIGRFHFGRQTGHGLFINNLSSEVFSGEYHSDLKHGHGVLFHENHIYDIEYQRGIEISRIMRF